MADLPTHLSPKFLKEHAHDGWWPYWPGKEPSTEATSWCAMACRNEKDVARKALEYLLSIQNSDGGWSTRAGAEPSDWTTGLALVAIQVLQRSIAADNDKSDEALLAKTDKSVKNSAIYLLRTRPDFLNDFTRTTLYVVFGDDAVTPGGRGWAWNPDTYFWVEPTSYAVLALKLSPLAEQKRYKIAIQEAQDYYKIKQCASGGWNYGTPKSVVGDQPSQVVPTAWALMALHGSKEQSVQKAVTWMRDADDVTTKTLQARSLSILALNAHGADIGNRVEMLHDHFADHKPFTDNLFLAGLCSLAASVPDKGNPFIV